MKSGKLSLLTAVAIFAAFPALAQSHCDQVTAMTESGTIKAKGYSAGFLIGARWGEGEVTLKDGSKHKFSFYGAKVLETGASEGEMEGTVYNLTNIADFEGFYQGASATLTLVKQVNEGEQVFNNSKCVLVKAKATTAGLRLSPPGGAGVEVKLEK